LLALRGDHRQVAKALHAVSPLSRITQADRVTGQALDGFTNVFTADQTADQRLDIGDVQSVLCGHIATDIDVDITSAGETFSQCRGDAGHFPDQLFDALRDRVNGVEVVA